MTSEPIVLALVSAAIGWIVRHLGLGSGLAGGKGLSPASKSPLPLASITGGIKAEIEAIVAESVKAAVATALADLRTSTVQPKA